jgi:hypothetical protein
MEAQKECGKSGIINVMSCCLGNYISNVGMTSISGLAIDGLSGNLIVTGKNAAGATITAFIDVTGAINGNPTISTPVDNRVTF